MKKMKMKLKKKKVIKNKYNIYYKILYISYYIYLILIFLGIHN